MEYTQTCSGSTGCGRVDPVSFCFFIIALKIPLIRAQSDWLGGIQNAASQFNGIICRQSNPPAQERLLRSIMSGKTLSHDISTGGVYHTPGVF
jgi:hypothetical protein